MTDREAAKAAAAKATGAPADYTHLPKCENFPDGKPPAEKVVEPGKEPTCPNCKANYYRQKAKEAGR